MNFQQPSALWLLPLAPLAALTAVLLWRRWMRASRAWAARGLWRRLDYCIEPWRLWTATVLLTVAVLAIVIGLARPRWGHDGSSRPARGADVVLLLDASLSMAVDDVLPSRLDAAKSLTRQLLPELRGGRVALVLMEGQGHVISPLTPDLDGLDLMLDSVHAGSLIVPGTSLAAALPQAAALLADTGDRQRVILLLTDGEDHSGELAMQLQRLRNAGITVYAVGIGTLEGARVPAAVGDSDFKRHSDGSPVISRLRPEPLQQLVDATGGLYLEAQRAGIDPAPLLQHLDQLRGQPLLADTRPGARNETLRERFQLPLVAAVVALLLQLFLRPAPPSTPGASPPRPRRRPRITAALAGLLLVLPGPVPHAQDRPTTPDGPSSAVGATSDPALAAAPATSDDPSWNERLWHNPRAATGSGLAAYREGNFTSAAEDFEQARRWAPDDPRVLYNAGTSLSASGSDIEDAIELLQAAADAAMAAGATAGSDLAADAWYNLGNAHLDANDAAAAIEAYKQALRVDPGHQDAKFNLEWALLQQQPESPSAPPQPPPPPAPEPPPPQPQPQPSDGFEEQEEMTPEQAQALLNAVDNLERQQQQEQSEPQRARPNSGAPDW